MVTRRLKNHFWVWRRGERGDGALGSVISMGMFITLLVLFVWMILTYYSFRVLASAANEGAAVAAQYDVASDGNQEVSRQQGEIYAEQLIANAGARALVENVDAEAEIVGDRAQVVVTGRAITPLFAMNLSATGSAPIEQFRPQGDELP